MYLGNIPYRLHIRISFVDVGPHAVEIRCPEANLAGIISHLQRRRARILTEEKDQAPKKPTMYTSRLPLLIVESFGFHAEIDASRKERASVGMSFDKWKCIPGYQ